MKNPLLTTIYSMLMLVILIETGNAQPPSPPPQPVPIDGGLGILLATAAVLGGKKAWDVNKKDT